MQDKIKAEMKAAMMAKAADKLQVMRMISAAFTNELVSQGHPPTDALSDEDAMKVIKRLANQRKDSITQFVAGGREDLASDERAELAIIQTLLPAQMSIEEVRAKVTAKITEGSVDKSKKGPFMGMMMRELGDSADSAIVKSVIDELLV